MSCSYFQLRWIQFFFLFSGQATSVVGSLDREGHGQAARLLRGSRVRQGHRRSCHAHRRTLWKHSPSSKICIYTSFYKCAMFVSILFKSQFYLLRNIPFQVKANSVNTCWWIECNFCTWMALIDFNWSKHINSFSRYKSLSGDTDWSQTILNFCLPFSSTVEQSPIVWRGFWHGHDLGAVVVVSLGRIFNGSELRRR